MSLGITPAQHWADPAGLLAERFEHVAPVFVGEGGRARAFTL